MEEGRPEAEEPFPDKDYLAYVFACMDLGTLVLGKITRHDALVGLRSLSHAAGHENAYCGVLFQTQKNKKVIQLVEYAKHLWRNSDPRIKAAFPLAKPVEHQADHELKFANGSHIIGIPGGADQIRSYHPWAYLNDESSFQPDAGSCYNEALAAVKGKIIFNSSAGPSWYSDVRHDIIRNGEE